MDEKQLEQLVARAPKTLHLGDLEPQVLALALDHKTFFLNMSCFLEAKHFDNPLHAQVWSWFVAFFREKHVVPSRLAVEHAFSKADVHFSLPTLDIRSSEYVKDEVYRIVRGQQLERFMVRLLLETQNSNPRLPELYQELGKIVNMGSADGAGWLNYFDVDNRYAKLSRFWEGRIPTGYPTLDQMLPGGGLGRKEMMGVMGPPGAGKCVIPTTEVDAEIDFVIEIGSSDKIIPGGPINESDGALSLGFGRQTKCLACDYTIALSDLWEFRAAPVGDQGLRRTHGEVSRNRPSTLRDQRLSAGGVGDGGDTNLHLWLRPKGEVCKKYALAAPEIRDAGERLSELPMDILYERTGGVDTPWADTKAGGGYGRSSARKKPGGAQGSAKGQRREQQKVERLVPRVLDRQGANAGRSEGQDQGNTGRKREESEKPHLSEWLQEPVVLTVYRHQEQLHVRRSQAADANLWPVRIKTSAVREKAQPGNDKKDCRSEIKRGAMGLCEQGILPLAEWVEDLVRRCLRDRIYPLVRTELEKHSALQGFGNQVLRSPYVQGENVLPRLPGRRLPRSGGEGDADCDRRSKGGSSHQALRRALPSLNPNQVGRVARILPAPSANVTAAVPRTDTANSQGCEKRIWRVTLRCRCQIGFLVGLKTAMPDLPIRVLSETGYRQVEQARFTQPNPEWHLETEDGHELYCADDHRVQTKSGFGFARKLKAGIEILTKRGWSKIVVAQPTGRTLPMVDLQMEGRHYFANGILSHNTTWLINLASRAITQGYKVLHITREVSEDFVGLRYDCCFLQATSTELLGDRPATIDRIKRLRADLKLASPLFIREYPTGGTTIEQCRADYLSLREREGFQTDIVVDDYPDLAKPSRGRDKEYSEQGLIFAEFRGWMVEDETVGLVGTQTVRSAEDLNDDVMIKMKHSADSYHKPRLMDALFTINESAEDKTTGHQKLYAAKNRNERADVWGKFKVDKAKMRVSDIFQSSYDMKVKQG